MYKGVFSRSLPDDVVDDDGVWWEQQVGETLRDLGELQSGAVENLTGTKQRETVCEKNTSDLLREEEKKNLQYNATLTPPRTSGNDTATWR